MKVQRDLMRRIRIQTTEGEYTLTLCREDFSALYPGMVRYALSVESGGLLVSAFHTNTYEYSPTCPLEAESVVLGTADEWENEIRENPLKFVETHLNQEISHKPPEVIADVVVIQGSPRADGNCSILASWSAEAAHELEKTILVIYPDDMNIKPCIGCYQCYNNGTCTFEDDMTGIISAIEHSALLVLCTPVYTNTVPGGLKLLIDRCQALHAKRFLQGKPPRSAGLLFSVAGRKGSSNFTCITRIVEAFMENLGITPADEILLDGIDEIRDIHRIPGLQDRVRAAVRENISLHDTGMPPHTASPPGQKPDH